MLSELLSVKVSMDGRDGQLVKRRPTESVCGRMELRYRQLEQQGP